MSLVKFTRFMNDAAALEKTLRLLQGIAQLAASVFAYLGGLQHLVDVSAAFRKHFALGRRYFRYFKWMDCAIAASDAVRGRAVCGKEGLFNLLVVAKWSYLGMYMFMEAFTILDVMGIHKSSWTPTFHVEGMRFWFYSITCSIILSIYELHSSSKETSNLKSLITASTSAPSKTHDTMATTTPPKKHPKSNNKKAAQEPNPPPTKDENPAPQHQRQHQKDLLTQTRARHARAFRSLVISACDLLTPGAIVNWIPAPPAAVAITSIASSFLSAQDIWRRVNASSP